MLYRVLDRAGLALTSAEPLSAFAMERISAGPTTGVDRIRPGITFFHGTIWLSLCCISFALLLGGSAVLVVLFLVEFLFPAGPLVTIPLKVLVCSWMVAWNLLDYPLGLRHGVIGSPEMGEAALRRPPLFGFLWSMFALVPGIILVLLPMGVAAVTPMVLRDDPKPPNVV